MKTKIINDINGTPYIAVDIPTDHDGMFKLLLDWAFKNIDDFAAHNNRLLLRNDNKFHITVFNVAECTKNASLLHCVDDDIIDIELSGIGSIHKDEMTTFFIVCKSQRLNLTRKYTGLSPKDFHITIGFTDKDLFVARKNNPNIINNIL